MRFKLAWRPCIRATLNERILSLFFLSLFLLLLFFSFPASSRSSSFLFSFLPSSREEKAVRGTWPFVSEETQLSSEPQLSDYHYIRYICMAWDDDSKGTCVCWSAVVRLLQGGDTFRERKRAINHVLLDFELSQPICPERSLFSDKRARERGNERQLVFPWNNRRIRPWYGVWTNNLIYRPRDRTLNFYSSLPHTVCLFVCLFVSVCLSLSVSLSLGSCCSLLFSMFHALGSCFHVRVVLRSSQRHRFETQISSWMDPVVSDI